MTKSKTGPNGPDKAVGSEAPGLVICRNKHWRYISSYHGPWLQLPPEILDSLAHQNYTMPSPRLIDPSVFYDVVKIRKAVDEAAQESVRASTGINNAGSTGGKMDLFGLAGGGGGGPPQSQLSKERIFKIRQKAVRLLSRAFALDEVAASVATMQATSTVEDVGAHVLKREHSNADAKYVHFFHEKIPSRAMEQHTPLDPLDEIISSLSLERKGPPLRTRGMVQLFKQEWDGAIIDLTNALRIVEELKRTHKPDQQQLELASRMRKEQESWEKSHKDWRSVPHLKEEEQPQSLEMQLHFNRGAAYLALACHNVDAALNGLKAYQEAHERGEVSEKAAREQESRLEARKKVKTYAKRALKDLTAFLSNFDYTPGLPYEITNEIMRRVYDLANGVRTQQHTQAPLRNRLIELNSSDDEQTSDSTSKSGNSSAAALVKHQRTENNKHANGDDGWLQFPVPKIYAASALFAEKPPADLPPFPSEKTTAAMLNNETVSEAFGSREAVTYHPLLTDALHSLLLCHALLQTSPTELLRHAHNAARLARIADGYPIFQAARSPARADWIEVLRRANNWLGLSVPWQRLCAPAPLPEAAGGWAKENGSASKKNGTNGTDSSSAVARKNSGDKSKQSETETAEQKRERIKQESIIDALSDDRVVDEASFQRAVRAREQRAMEDEQGLSGPLHDKEKVDSPLLENGVQNHEQPHQQHSPAPKRWAQDENGTEYPISTDRAEAISRWIKEAPLSMGTRKKRPAKKKRPAPAPSSSVASTTASVERLNVEPKDDGPD